ncbi:MAG: hypothetical protein AB9919_14685 [Geobacteraceae bacterium]
MGYQPIKITREALYEEVWLQPLTKVALKYGITDNGIRKICKRLNVPLPVQGYWLRKYKSKPKPLPPEGVGPKEHVLQIYCHESIPLTAAEVSEEEKMIQSEKNPDNRIVVKESLASPHPLVSSTEKRLKKKNTTKMGNKNEAQCFAVSVYPESVDRALRVMDALIKALSQRGIPLFVDEQKRTVVKVMGEDLGISMSERSRRIDHVPTVEEKKNLKEYSWWSVPKYDFVPSGELFLQIEGWLYGERQTWSDGKKQRLEDLLNSFVIGLIRAAMAQKKVRIEREQEKLEWQERERIRIEQERLRQEENERINKLLHQTDNWHRSQQILEYMDALQKEAIKGDREILPGSKLACWIFWATQYAYRINPLNKLLKKIE